ncbi:CbtB-domain containing protein [Mycolicibacterium sp. P1-18]|uniref:CbtB domain-containing protein n=1 Tax=Mycolicibacterium sp. P1-18 TaxID=2024615 RepID=UPI0011F1488D|nr:CbtB-domain containing protein [Mycolicibacterium sp. P1-18]KAA0097976.1 CbtB-domain containing protein [Mycolicibacterium sp. P1-18]
MSHSVILTAGVEVPSLPLGKIAPWAVFYGLLAILALYFVSTEQGALSMFSGTEIHEWVHDARHLLGYPCH